MLDGQKNKADRKMKKEIKVNEKKKKRRNVHKKEEWRRREIKQCMKRKIRSERERETGIMIEKCRGTERRKMERGKEIDRQMDTVEKNVQNKK